MFNQSQDYFALNFSQNKIRVLKLNHSGKKVLSSGEIKIPSQVIVKGRVKDTVKLAKAIKTLLQKTNIKEKFVIVGLPEDQAFMRTLSLPSLPSEEISQAIQWRSDSLLPLPFEKVYLDWRLISQSKQEKQVLLVAISRDLIDGYVQVLSQLSLKPVAFEMRSLSLARLAKQVKEKMSLMIEIEEPETTLAIVQSPETLILSSTFKGEIPKSEEFFQLILQMISFHQKRQKIDQPLKIFITGEKANQSLASKIASQTQSPTSLFLPQLANFDQPRSLSFSATIALAFKEVAAPIDEETINLLPPQIQGVYDRLASRQRKINWLKLYSLWLFFFLLISGFFLFKLAKLSSSLKEEIISRQSLKISDEQRQAQAQAKEINQKSQALSQLIQQRPKLTEILTDLSSSLPHGVTLTHLSFEEKKTALVLEGRAVTRDLLLSFKDELEEKDYFSKVEIPLSSLEKKDNFSFSLTAYLVKN